MSTDLAKASPLWKLSTELIVFELLMGQLFVQTVPLSGGSPCVSITATPLFWLSRTELVSFPSYRVDFVKLDIHRDGLFCFNRT